MAKRAKQTFSSTGQTIPDWKSINPDMKPITRGGLTRDYKRLVWEAEYYVHYEVATKTLANEFTKWVGKAKSKDDAKILKNLPDGAFAVPGKYAYMVNKGAVLDEYYMSLLDNAYAQLLERALAIVAPEEEDDDDDKPKAPVISIQDRMKEQLERLVSDFEIAVDAWLDGEDVSKFDPYKMIQAYDGCEVKPAHAKILRDTFEPAFEEAKLLVEWKDEDIKEGYEYTTAKSRKALLALYEKIMTACDTVINTGKTQRKPRKPKAQSKDKLVAKLKYKESEPSLGLASINPVSIVEADQLWVYNTKNRKLQHFVADSMTGPLTVKGTTILGFDAKKSTQKTVRKPEVLKGSSKLARTKFDKLYSELTTTETMVNGRMNEHCILIRVF